MRKAILTILMILLWALPGCRKNSFEDSSTFAIHYMGISNIHPGETATSSPSYLGAAPTGFSIYSVVFNGNIFYDPRIDGPLDENSTFYVDQGTGTFKIQNTSSLKAGTYKVSVKCSSAGKQYDCPDAITIIMLKEK